MNSDFSFNLQAYKEYSPIFLPASFVIAYGLCFATITATATHIFLYHRNQLWSQARHTPSVKLDIHARLMSVYKEVPDWWYLIILCLFRLFLRKKAADILLSDHVGIRHRYYRGVGHGSPCMGIHTFPLDLCAFSLCACHFTKFNICCVPVFVWIVPIGVVMAISSQVVELNVFSELVIGYILPGRPIANMMFKTWCTNTTAQAIQFTSNFKLGHYMKIPPRSMLLCQVVSTIVAGTVQLCVQEWMFSNIEDICSPDQKDGFICPSATVFGTASIIVRLSTGIYFLISIAQCLLLYRSGVSLGHNVYFRMDSSILASCFFSWSAHLHHYFSGFCTRSSGPISSSTSTSRSSLVAWATCLRRRPSTMCPVCSFALSLTMSSVGATLPGGLNTTVNFHVLCFCFLDHLTLIFFFRCVVRCIGFGLSIRYPHSFLCFAIPKEWQYRH